MVEARSSPRTSRQLKRTPSASSSASAEVAATLAAFVAAAEKLSDSDGEDRLWTAPEVHELPQFQGCLRGVALPPPQRQQQQQDTNQPSALATQLRRAALPKPPAVSDEEDSLAVDTDTTSYFGSQPCSQGSSAPSHTTLYRCDPIGRRMRNSKLRHVWMLRLAGEPHDTKVELLHSRLTGKKQVLVDGKVMYSTRQKCLNWYWEHPPSHARITLRSENGSHQLLCEKPEIEPVPAKEPCAPSYQPSSPHSPCICQSPPRRSPRSPAPLSSPQPIPLSARASAKAAEATDLEGGHVYDSSAASGITATPAAPSQVATSTMLLEDAASVLAAELVQEAVGAAGADASAHVDSSATTVLPVGLSSVSTLPPEEMYDLGSPYAVEPLQLHAVPALVACEEEGDCQLQQLAPGNLSCSDPSGKPDQQTEEVASDGAAAVGAGACEGAVTDSAMAGAATSIVGSTGSAETMGSTVDVLSESLTARDEENQRLQELIEQRDAQIAALQGQIRRCEPGGDPYPAYGRGVHVKAKEFLSAAIPPVPSVLPIVPVAVTTPSAPASSSTSEAVPTAEPEKSPEVLEYSPLDDEELDVTRRLGPVFQIPNAAPANIRSASVHSGYARAASTVNHAERCRPAPVGVKVEVQVEQMSMAAPRARVRSTPPAVQYLRPQSAQRDGGQPSGVSSSRAQTPVQRRQVMTPRRLVPAPPTATAGQHQSPRIMSGAGQLRSATPGPPQGGHFSTASSSRPSAPAVAPTPLFVGRPGAGSLRFPAGHDATPSSQGTPRAGTPQARAQNSSIGPPHGGPTAAGHSFGLDATPMGGQVGNAGALHCGPARSLVPPPGLTLPGGLTAGFTAPGSAESAEAAPGCLRLPPGPLLAPPGGWNGIGPCGAGVRHLPGPPGGNSIGQALGPGLQSFPPSAALRPTAQ